MILVVGLGNIGKEYENTRHNVGFMLLDRILKELQIETLVKANFKGELYKKDSSFLLLKPHTFMNASGISVSAVKAFYKCERMIVIHDDIDLPLGTLKFKDGGGNGGHNGLKSIDKYCTNRYERIRIGIGKGTDVNSYVLAPFKEEEKPLLNSVLEQAQKALFELLRGSQIYTVGSEFSLKA
ncbi:aminoacyl-tRNA hydrolase [Campylobacter sp. MIT 21-1685]|uniref:aminoacyl-tRNA hydrolase n=1 Tax=unclassified Campylobacter TaxID=2593542 RepID=UPI00224AEB1C|nr:MULTISPECIES: aminoacyl-tRNA hydrolase [unclassified Campylobacter]MCX2683033.1 aminoacyl-tRNA hydrolase [Campylobacter sp. MIT 21-1684]MCX2751315.1 aminoacyl-tRNA hydrolase [Campylobacter sp. MIT 21-1682]MCX2807514.1 aminoacyl-tRNA hydrolase [Campylobacter sp. MIT 21-1685]